MKSVVKEKKRKRRKDQNEADREKEVEARNDPEVENEGKFRRNYKAVNFEISVQFTGRTKTSGYSHLPFILAKVENDQDETEVHPDQRNRNDPDGHDHVTRSVPDLVIENAIHVTKKKMVPMLK